MFFFIVSATAAATPSVQQANTLTGATQLLLSGARCVVVRRAFVKARYLPPPNFDLRDLLLPAKVDIPFDTEISHVLEELSFAHRAATKSSTSRGRVARVRGTPCPRAHVDKLRLRALVTLRGPGVVILNDDNADDVHVRTGTGDAVFMTGFCEDDPTSQPVWHRSPRRANWMPDRLIVQVDDW